MSNGSTKPMKEADKIDRTSTAFQFLEGMLALEKMGPYFSKESPSDTMGRLQFMAEHYEEIHAVSAATPEPAPVKNNYPAVADVVAAEVVAEYGLQGLGLADDVMARKAFGLKKYGTALQPFNGRDSSNDLYQELVDGMKYARLLMMEDDYNGKATTPYEDVYIQLRALAHWVKKLQRDKANGQASSKGSKAGG